MRSLSTAAAVLFALAGIAQPAEAVCLDNTAHYVKSGYYRNQCWPWPYVCPDRLAVREPMCLMIENGWRRQNLIGHYYFSPDSTQLTAAGELRVRWIMTQVPPERRNIFVERGDSSEVTQQRVEAVRSFAAQIAVNGAVPSVTDTYLVSEGRPASVVDATNIKFNETMPAPRLPADTASTSGGSSTSTP
jgi:hypothetical protein